MSNTTTKTWRLGGAAGYSVHAVQALTEGEPTYRRSLGFANSHPVYTRVELWKDAEDEADVQKADAAESASINDEEQPHESKNSNQPDEIVAPGRLPQVRVDPRRLSLRPMVLVPQYPISFRELTQVWRRLRRPIRIGPATEFDVRETIAARTKLGVVTPPVLVPRRRNTTRLLILVDSGGSMEPLRDFVDLVCRTIMQSAQLAESAFYYFHDSPVEGSNDVALGRISQDSLFPSVDSVLPYILPAADGWLYRDYSLTQPVLIKEVLRQHTESHGVVIISDAGAARGSYSMERIIDCLGFAKALRTIRKISIWLNPIPAQRWRKTSAAELARYIPMFPIDKRGIFNAVGVLRGHPTAVERAF